MLAEGSAGRRLGCLLVQARWLTPSGSGPSKARQIAGFWRGPAGGEGLYEADRENQGVQGEEEDTQELELWQRTEEAWVDGCRIGHSGRSTNAVEAFLDQKNWSFSHRGGEVHTGTSDSATL